jgi:hypothetical protein
MTPLVKANAVDPMRLPAKWLPTNRCHSAEIQGATNAAESCAGDGWAARRNPSKLNQGEPDESIDRLVSDRLHDRRMHHIAADRECTE